jgi:hypothetical protein
MRHQFVRAMLADLPQRCSMSSKYARAVIVLLFVVVSGFLLKAPQGFKFALGMGYYLRDSGHPAASVPFFYVASLNNPQSHLPHWGLGTMLAELGHKSSSLPHFRRAVAIKPDWDRACWPATIALEVNDPAVANELIALGMANNHQESVNCIFNHFARLTWSDDKSTTHSKALAESEALIRVGSENWLWWEVRRRLWERQAWHIHQRALSVVDEEIEQNTLVAKQISDAEYLAGKFPKVVQAKKQFLASGRAALSARRYKDARDWFVAGSKHDPSLLEEQAAVFHRDDGGRGLAKSLTELDGLTNVDPYNVMWWSLRHHIWRARFKHVGPAASDCRQLAVSYSVHEQQLADADRLVKLYPENARSRQYRVEVGAVGQKVREFCKDQRG